MINSTALNSTTNRTNSVPSTFQLTDVEWVVGIFLTHGLVALFIVISNLGVLCAFIKNGRLRTTTNIVLMSMAVADLLVGLMAIPFWMYTLYAYYELSIHPFPKSFFWYFARAYQNIDQILVLVSIYHLVYLHSLRSYSIVFPLRHRQMSKRPVLCAIVLIWLISIALPPVIRYIIIADSCRLCFVYMSLPLNIGIPLVIMSVANLVLYRTVAKSSRQHQNKDNKILVTIGILIGLLVVCYLPFLITNVMNSLNYNLSLPTVIIVKFLHFINSALNPVVYALRNPDLGRAINTMVCGKQQRNITSTARTMASGVPSRSVIITTT